jgi:hypothetical protein
LYDEKDLVTSAFAGTHQYIAPEIAEGDNEFYGIKRKFIKNSSF